MARTANDIAAGEFGNLVFRLSTAISENENLQELLEASEKKLEISKQAIEKLEALAANDMFDRLEREAGDKNPLNG